MFVKRDIGEVDCAAHRVEVSFFQRYWHGERTWRSGKRSVTLVGVNFNPAKRNIDMPIIEPL